MIPSTISSIDTASILASLPNVCGIAASSTTLGAAIAMGLPILFLGRSHSDSPKVKSAASLFKVVQGDADPSTPEASTKSTFARVAVSKSSGGTVLVELTHLVRCIWISDLSSF